MGDHIIQDTQKERRRRELFRSLLVLLSSFVFFVVAWVLRIDGISMTDEPLCGIEGHVHQVECYYAYPEGTVSGGDRVVLSGTVSGGDVGVPGTMPGEDAEILGTMSGEDGEIPGMMPGENAEILGTMSGEDAEIPGTMSGEDAELSGTMSGENVEIPAMMSGEEAGGAGTVSGGDMMSLFALRATEPVVYVKTALGQREKDRIHEYGDHAYFPPGIVAVDGYIPNSSQEPYVLHPGDTVELTAVMDIDPGSYTPATGPVFQLTGEAGEYLKLENQPESLDDVGGKRSLTAKVTVYENEDVPGGSHPEEQIYPIVFGEGEDTVYFYLQVRNEPDRKYDHADIEIMDDGFFEIIEPRLDGTRLKMTFAAYVVGVNKCEIYDKGDAVIQTFLKEDYQSNGEPGEPQYELTSKYLCRDREEKHFSWKDAEYAVFDVKINLQPRSREILDADDHVIGTEPVDHTGDSDLWIQSAVFRLDYNSVVDANNKCPDHSGLDFTLERDLKSLILTAPVSLELTAEKEYDGAAPAAGAFAFELLDADGQVLDRASNDAAGKIRFDRQYFVNPGEYTFRIREVMPTGAVDIGIANVLYFQGVRYDSRTHEITVTVTDDGAGNLSVLPVATVPVFSNLSETENTTGDKYIDLSVKKDWSDGESGHSEDRVYFRILRTEEGKPESRQEITIDGQRIFELSKSVNWQWSCHDLPKKVQGHSYIYEVEEIDPPAGYRQEYSSELNEAGVELTILNIKEGTRSISLQKEWYDEDGHALAEAPRESVLATIKRKSMEIEVPVRFEVRDSSGNLVYMHPETGSERLTAFVGSKMTIGLSLAGADKLGTMDKVAVIGSGTEQCKCSITSWDADTAEISVWDIKPGAKVTIQCDNLLTDGDLLLHQNFEGTQHDWQPNDGDSHTVYLGSGWYTCQSSIDDGTHHPHSLKIGNRKGYQIDGNWIGSWMGAYYRLTDTDRTKLLPGGTYSISVYGTYNNHFTAEKEEMVGKELTGHSVRAFSLTLLVENGTEKEYINVDSRALPFMSQLAKLNFKMPQYTDDTVLKLIIDTGEDPFLETVGGSTQGYYSDLFIDELVVAPAGVAVTVQKDGRVLRGNANYALAVSKQNTAEIEQMASEWRTDDAWSREVTLKSASNWKLTLTAADLEELPNKEYQYYVEETVVPGYSVQYDGDYVGSNTTGTPIRILNTAIPYMLPQTGGRGTRGLGAAGILLVLAGAVGAGCAVRRRPGRLPRGKPPGAGDGSARDGTARDGTG